MAIERSDRSDEDVEKVAAVKPDGQIWTAFPRRAAGVCDRKSEGGLMEDKELARRAYALPDRFADRLDPKDLANIREYANVGEWGEEIEELLASLRHDDRTITAAEHQEIQTLLDVMSESPKLLDQLRVTTL